MTPKAFESLMTWEAHQLQDNFFHCFEKVVLKKDVGKFSAGTEFHFALFDTRLFVLSLYEKDAKTPKEAIEHSFCLENFVFGDEIVR